MRALDNFTMSSVVYFLINGIFLYELWNYFKRSDFDEQNINSSEPAPFKK